MPLLPPPPLQFPQRFSNDESEQQPDPPAQAAWPDEDVERDPQRQDPIEWGLKTQGEQHLDRLEARLAQLAADTDPSPRPGIGPSLLSPVLPSSDLSDDDGDHETDTQIEQPEGVAVGDEGDEGRALLSAVGSPSGHDEASRQALYFSDGEDGEVLDGARGSTVEQDRAQDPPLDLAPAVLQRISFRDTVRISGGMRSSSRPHRHNRHAEGVTHPLPLNERTSLLSSQARPISAPSDLLVAVVDPSGGPSRSSSPASRSRRASMSSSLRSGTSFAHLHPSSYPMSSSPTSYGASRSSSPCSSIYAPLQPPSKYSPNPLWVRTTSQQRGLRRTRSGSNLSFQDFLRSGAAYASADDEEDSDDDDDNAEGDAFPTAADEFLDPRGRRFGPSHAEYRDLVEAQRARRERWEARRAAKEAHARAAEAKARRGARFWDRLAGLLALGMVGAGPARAGGMGGTATGNGHGGMGASAGMGPGGGQPGGTGRGRGRSPARPSPLRRGSSARTPSALSVESSAGSTSSLEAQGDDDDGLRPSRRHLRAPVPSRPGRPQPVVKTEVDVRFGPAPARYFRLDWLRYKLAQLVLAAREALRTALVGLERQSGARRREAEYEEV